MAKKRPAIHADADEANRDWLRIMEQHKDNSGRKQQEAAEGDGGTTMSSPQSGVGNVHVPGPMQDFSVRGGAKKPAPKPAPKPARQPARKSK